MVFCSFSALVRYSLLINEALSLLELPINTARFGSIQMASLAAYIVEQLWHIPMIETRQLLSISLELSK